MPRRCDPMSLEEEIDLLSLAERAAVSVRAPAEFKEDLVQEAVVTSIELLRRFQPGTGADFPEPRVQAERYVFVCLRWHLRAYLRRMRSPLPVPDHDRRLVRAYDQVAAEQGSLSLDQAAFQLNVKSKRLAAALAARGTVVSLDYPAETNRGNEGGMSLGQQLPSKGPGTEDLAIAAIEAEIRSQHQAIIGRVIQDEREVRLSTRERNQNVHRLVYLLLDQLPRGDAEVIRLAFALRREEVEALRSCRAYGCRRDRGHSHSPHEIARWVGGDGVTIEQRLKNGLDELRDLLGGRDAAQFLHELSEVPGFRSRPACDFPPQATRRVVRRVPARPAVEKTNLPSSSVY